MIPFITSTDGIVLGSYRPKPLGIPLPRRRSFVISSRDIQQHGHIIGLSGFGKSKHIARLFLELNRLDCAVTVIDPHGDLSKEILQHLVAQGSFDTREGFKRFIYLDLPRAEAENRYMPFNVLDQPFKAETIAGNVLDVCHRAWPELAQGAANFDQLLPDCVQLLVRHGLPFTMLWKILANEPFRQALLDQETDQHLVDSFRDLYDHLKKADQVQYAGSLLRRARQLTRLSVLRYGLEQRHMLLDFESIMNNGTSVIINLALEDADARRLVGCFLLVAAEKAAKARANIPEDKRRPHHLIVDEAPEYIANSEKAFKNALSQARKYKMRLWMAHQNWAQMPEELRGSVQNAGINIAFNVGVDDAQYQARLIGRLEKNKVKHEVTDEQAKGRTHPAFETPDEQWQLQAQELRDQWPQEATVSYNNPTRLRHWLHQPLRRTVRIKTQHLASPTVDPKKLAEVEAYYLRWCFRSQTEIEEELEQLRGSLPTVRRITRGGVE